jgi:hypothetical protein
MIDVATPAEPDPNIMRIFIGGPLDGLSRPIPVERQQVVILDTYQDEPSHVVGYYWLMPSGRMVWEQE